MLNQDVKADKLLMDSTDILKVLYVEYAMQHAPQNCCTESFFFF